MGASKKEEADLADWAAAQAATIVTLNSPESFCGLYDFATSSAKDDNSKLTIAQVSLTRPATGRKAEPSECMRR